MNLVKSVKTMNLRFASHSFFKKSLFLDCGPIILEFRNANVSTLSNRYQSVSNRYPAEPIFPKAPLSKCWRRFGAPLARTRVKMRTT